MAEIWEQQPTETMLAYAYFAYYRDLGGLRTQTDAARHFRVTPATLSHISRRHNWLERVRAYDAWMESRLREHRLREILAMDERQAGLALLMQEKVAINLEKMPDIVATALSPKDVVAMLATATRVERAARRAETSDGVLPRRSSGDKVGVSNVSVNVASTAQSSAAASVQQVEIIETIVRTRDDVHHHRNNPKAEILRADE